MNRGGKRSNAGAIIRSNTPESMSSSDHITLHGLGLTAHLGVPEEERAVPQRVEADLTLWPAEDLAGLNDDLARTVDYSRAATLCREVAGSRPWRLIESLAEALCTALLGAYGLRSVRVAVHKFIVPDSRAVSVTLTRGRDAAASTLT
jgi:dihydroneopterin aldolase